MSLDARALEAQSGTRSTRLPDGRQVQKKIGPAWTDRGHPPNGYFTKRTAEARMRDLLDEARRGTLPSQVRTSATFADAAAEWLRYIEHDRKRKPSTLEGYRSVVRTHLLPTFGEVPIESITTRTIDQWIAGVERSVATKRLGAGAAARDLQARNEGLGLTGEPRRPGREATAA